MHVTANQLAGHVDDDLHVVQTYDLPSSCSVIKLRVLTDDAVKKVGCLPIPNSCLLVKRYLEEDNGRIKVVETNFRVQPLV